MAAYAASRHGVTLALHPEAFTMFRTSRDVDLMMTLRDPTTVNLCPATAKFTVARSDPIAIAAGQRITVDGERGIVVLTE